MPFNKIYVKKGIAVKIDKALLDLGQELQIRVKTAVRDELERTYKDNIRHTYTPTGERGRTIAEYNKTHKNRQKAANYHHTGTLLRSMHGKIDGNTVKVTIDPDARYEDGTTAYQVYKWLSQGTRKKPRYPYYPVEGPNASDTPWAKYEPTPIHPFNQLTISDMDNYLERLTEQLNNEEGPLYDEVMYVYKKKQRQQKQW